MDSKKTEQYDAVIIGAGQSGVPLALYLAGEGKKTALVERKLVGGTCVNWGCTPTKTLVGSAQTAWRAKNSEKWGIKTSGVDTAMQQVTERKNAIVSESRKKIHSSLENQENLHFVAGEASFVNDLTVEIKHNENGTRWIKAPDIFIDTGSTAVIPDIPGLQETTCLTSTSILDLTEVPAHLLVIGGGYIGVEFAQTYRRLGAEVTMLEAGDRLLAREDEDISQEMEQLLASENIEIKKGVKLKKASEKGEKAIELQFEDAEGNSHSLGGSHLLIATGRKPNTDKLNLEATHLHTNDKGYINVNQKLQTLTHGIYAMGDVTGNPPFTHYSYDDFRIIKDVLAGGDNRSTDDRLLCYTIFTSPQLGRVGLNEQMAKQKDIPYKVYKMPMSSCARAYEAGETRGVMKVLADPETEKILGASILGIEGGEITSLLQVAMMGGITCKQLANTVFPHPTIAESLNNLFA